MTSEVNGSVGARFSRRRVVADSPCEATGTIFHLFGNYQQLEQRSQIHFKHFKQGSEHWKAHMRLGFASWVVGRPGREKISTIINHAEIIFVFIEVYLK